MPNTQRFFSKGVICENVYTSADWTYPSMTSIHTGQSLSRHKMIHPNILRKIDIEKGISFLEIDLYINEEIKDFKGPFSDSKQRVYNTLKTMILGYITGRYKQETDFFYNSVLN